MARVFLQPKEIDLLISHYKNASKLANDLDFKSIAESYKVSCAYFEDFAHSQTLQKIMPTLIDFQTLMNLLTVKIEQSETMAEVNELVGRANYFALFLKG